jgi:hypothetical protein
MLSLLYGSRLVNSPANDNPSASNRRETVGYVADISGPCFLARTWTMREENDGGREKLLQMKSPL